MRRSIDRQSLTALLLFLGLSLIFFGRQLFGHLSDLSIGLFPDTSFQIWCLVWWPYALTHHLNPFLTNVVWAPGPFNLSWATSAPLLNLCAWPLTATLGPIATFNVLCLMAAPLAAWTAFLLCRYVSGSFYAALLGGLVLPLSVSHS